MRTLARLVGLATLVALVAPQARALVFADAQGRAFVGVEAGEGGEVFAWAYTHVEPVYDGDGRGVISVDAPVTEATETSVELGGRFRVAVPWPVGRISSNRWMKGGIELSNASAAGEPVDFDFVIEMTATASARGGNLGDDAVAQNYFEFRYDGDVDAVVTGPAASIWRPGYGDRISAFAWIDPGLYEDAETYERRTGRVTLGPGQSARFLLDAILQGRAFSPGGSPQATVPLPATAPLLPLGLAALAGLAARRRARRG